jgi:hypothetical protein
MHKIALRRLYSQRLAGTPFEKPEEVVSWLGAVQAQDYLGAKWALSLRTNGLTDAVIERALDDGKILRTHLMRPTWHFVTPADIRWITELTAPRVRAMIARSNRQLELDEHIYRRSGDAIAAALQGGKQLMREELGVALAEVGIAAEGMRLGFIMHRAEVDALVCSGPRRGKQFTYMLLEERAPQAKVLAHDEALAELVRRYFVSHGPATAQDFAWWSGLTLADTKAGIDMVKPELDHEVIGGETYWFGTSIEPVKLHDMTYLLPNYDEYTVGYAEPSRAPIYGVKLKPKPDPRADSLINNVIVINVHIVGMWKRTFKKGVAVFEFSPFLPLTSAERQAVATEAERFGKFLGMSVLLPEYDA